MNNPSGYNRFALIVFKIVMIEAILFFVLALHFGSIIRLPESVIQFIAIPTFIFFIGDWWMLLVLFSLSLAGLISAKKTHEKGVGLSILGMFLSFMPWLTAMIIISASWNT